MVFLLRLVHRKLGRKQFESTHIPLQATSNFYYSDDLFTVSWSHCDYLVNSWWLTKAQRSLGTAQQSRQMKNTLNTFGCSDGITLIFCRNADLCFPGDLGFFLIKTNISTWHWMEVTAMFLKQVSSIAVCKHCVECWTYMLGLEQKDGFLSCFLTLSSLKVLKAMFVMQIRTRQRTLH